MLLTTELCPKKVCLPSEPVSCSNLSLFLPGQALETLMLPNQHEGLRIKSTELPRPPLAHAPQHHQMSWGGNRLHPGPTATYWHPRVRCEHRWLERKPHTLECSEPKESSISFVKTLLPLRDLLSQRAQPWSAFLLFVFSGGQRRGKKSCQYFLYISWKMYTCMPCTLIIPVPHFPLPAPCPLNWMAHCVSLVLPIDTWCRVVHWGIDSLLVATLAKEKLSFGGLYTWGRISHSLRWHQTF